MIKILKSFGIVTVCIIGLNSSNKHLCRFSLPNVYSSLDMLQTPTALPLRYAFTAFQTCWMSTLKLHFTGIWVMLLFCRLVVYTAPLNASKKGYLVCFICYHYLYYYLFHPFVRVCWTLQSGVKPSRVIFYLYHCLHLVIPRGHCIFFQLSV